MKTIIIKTDAGENIGFGHLRRCMTLAIQLLKHGCSVHFVVNNNLTAVSFLKKESLEYSIASENDNENFSETQNKIEQLNADILVVDSYKVQFEQLDKITIPKVYLDDLGITDSVFDLVINPSLSSIHEVSSGSRFLYGPKYALLREEFSMRTAKKRSEKIQKVLLTIGGSDPKNYTLKLLRCLHDNYPELEITVVFGPFFTKEVKKQILGYLEGKENIAIVDPPENLSLLMSESDLVVSAGGQTIYELAALGCLAIIFSVADNQAFNIEMFNKGGAICFIGSIDQENYDQVFCSELSDLLNDRNKRNGMSEAGMQLVDGLGAQRVALEICNLHSVDKKGVQLGI